MNFEKPTEVPNNKTEKTLIHSSGRESKAVLTLGEKIGSGYFGQVNKIEAIIREGKKPLIFAVKEFNDESDGVSRAISIHSALKKAGISTWPTYRAIRGEDSVLMTYGTPEGYFLVSPNNPSKSRENLLFNKYSEITNLGPVLREALEETIITAQKSISLNNNDVWFALFKDTEDNSIGKREGEIKKIFIGDFDNVKISTKNTDSEYAEYEAELQNISHLKGFILEIIYNFVEMNECQKYIDIIQKIIGDKEREIIIERYKKYSPIFDKEEGRSQTT